MSKFTEELKPVLASLRLAQSKKPANAMLFWTIFGEWMNATPNSPQDLLCIEKLKKERVFKKELLLAYHMLGETPLKDALMARINLCGEVTPEEWNETAHASLSFFNIKRKR